MSNKRHNEMQANDLIARWPNNLLISRFIDMATSQHDAPHSHNWHQMIYPKTGMLRTRAENKEYFIPSSRAIMIPANVVHESWALSNTEFIGIYINPIYVNDWPESCQIIDVSPLLRELTNYVAKEVTFSDAMTDENKRLINVLCDQLVLQNREGLELNLPTDSRLKQISDNLLENPANNDSLEIWSSKVGASERTISRLFVKETGLTFKKWRQRLKLITSVKYLKEGISIKEISYRTGYSSSSAFIYSFRQEFKVTPQKFVK